MISDSDARELAFPEKLLRYRELGVVELIAFDADAAEGAGVRAWDRIEDDLVEREVIGDSTRVCRSPLGSSSPSGHAAGRSPLV